MKNLNDLYKKSIEKELKKIDETGVNKTISKRKEKILTFLFVTALIILFVLFYVYNCYPQWMKSISIWLN